MLYHVMISYDIIQVIYNPGCLFENTFAFCFKFPNVCFSATRGLEVHVAGLEVPHCRGGVDPASDWTQIGLDEVAG